MTTRADLLLHPVRLRIVMAMAGEQLTTSQLAQRMSDVPQATLYRHVAILHEGGVLDVAEQTQNRGGFEKTYCLVDSAASVTPEEAAGMSTEEHLTGLTTFVGAVIDSTSRYLHSDGSQPGHDPFGYRQIPLWLSDDEAAAMVEALQAALKPFVANEHSTGRRRILFNAIVVPDVAAEASS